MKTKLLPVTIRDLILGYKDDSVNGGAVVGYSGNLNIRPPYQREFIYDKDEERKAVIHSIANKFPLNVMYWADGDGKGKYEILDGQQRTLCICKFFANEFTSDAFSPGEPKFFGTLDKNGEAVGDGLPKTDVKEFLDYELMVYHCIGDDRDKMRWFNTINIAGKQLVDQERLNAAYSCAWTTDARRYFSHHNAQAVDYGEKYLRGSMIRQDYLEQAIEWAALAEGDTSEQAVENYMATRKKNQEKSAKPLWDYFDAIFVWVEKVFRDYHKDAVGLDWGRLYHTHKNGGFEKRADDFAKRMKVLRASEDVKRSGIYEYLLTGKQKHINVRSFDKKLQQRMYKKQNGVCNFTGKGCDKEGKKLAITEMEADHITPWREGGPSNEDNCQMLCKDCNRKKGGR